MGCNNKIKHTCSDSLKAECVDYEGEVNSQSSLVDKSCLSIEETTQDIYTQLEEIDVTNIDDCLEYEKIDGKVQIKSAVKKHGEEICAIKTEIENIKAEAFLDLNISNVGLDFLCLETDCGNEIQTVKDLLQALINKVCTP